MDETNNWRIKTLVVGALLGAVAGTLGAFMLIQRSGQNQGQPKLTAGEGVKLGVSLLGVLKLISEISERK